MQPETRVSALTPDDLVALAALERCVFPDAWSETQLQRQLDAPRSVNLGLFCNGQLLGYALFSYVLDEAELLRIAVAPQGRRMGLARQLLHAALPPLSALGITRLMLEVRAGNAAAQALYAQFGFTEDARRRGYYRTPEGSEDAVLMSCFLAAEQSSADAGQ